jgi:hypothetical protein
VVTVAQLLAQLLRSDGTGCAEVRDAHSDEAVGQEVTEAAEVQLAQSLLREDQADVAVGRPLAEAQDW